MSPARGTPQEDSPTTVSRSRDSDPQHGRQCFAVSVCPWRSTPIACWLFSPRSSTSHPLPPPAACALAYSMPVQRSVYCPSLSSRREGGGDPAAEGLVVFPRPFNKRPPPPTRAATTRQKGGKSCPLNVSLVPSLVQACDWWCCNA